ncbi:MAG: hypothetical protein ACKVII_07515, partial [Planctomycetales bacterium]
MTDMHTHRWLKILTLAFLISFTLSAVHCSAQDDIEVSPEGDEDDSQMLMTQTEALDWALPVALCLAAT